MSPHTSTTSTPDAQRTRRDVIDSVAVSIDSPEARSLLSDTNRAQPDAPTTPRRTRDKNAAVAKRFVSFFGEAFRSIELEHDIERRDVVIEALFRVRDLLDARPGKRRGPEIHTIKLQDMCKIVNDMFGSHLTKANIRAFHAQARYRNQKRRGNTPVSNVFDSFTQHHAQPHIPATREQ